MLTNTEKRLAGGLVGAVIFASVYLLPGGWALLGIPVGVAVIGFFGQRARRRKP